MHSVPIENESLNPQFNDRTVRVFISSTFRDMHAERDYLVKFIFPKLNKLCEARGVIWSDVDLRWGVTNEQAAEGKVLPVCFEEIERCRPYFIGLLGERYGWIPGHIPDGLLEQEDWLNEFKGEKSVTELEILHGVLRNPAMAGHSFFYFRDPTYSDKVPIDRKDDFIAEDEKAKQKLDDLKINIRSSGLTFRENFSTPEDLGSMVLADFAKIIDTIYPEGSDPGYIGREHVEHESYAKSRASVYIGRDEYYANLDEHVEANYSAPMVITGESGFGKSALLANWAKRYKQKHPDCIIIQHYVGASRNSTDCIAMLRRILRELKWRLGFEQDMPETAEDILRDFWAWLYKASAAKRIILIIDAINQLEDNPGIYNLAWLPYNIPPGVRMFITTPYGQCLDECISRDWPGFEIEYLDIPEREKLITSYLKICGKQLAEPYIKLIANAHPTRNPLYLKTLLDELKLFGQHDRLEKKIDNYLEATDPEQLYEKIIARWEIDYEDNTDLVGDALSLIWASRQGLSETELLYALGTRTEPFARAKWSPLSLAMTGCLLDNGGLLNFAHDYIRQAVEALYLPTEEHQIRAHLKLADYFENEKGASPRKVFELPWQLSTARAWDRLETTLTNIPFFLALDQQGEDWELTGYWLPLIKSGRDMGKCYLTAYARWIAVPTNQDDHYITTKLGIFLCENGLYAASEQLLKRAMEVSRRVCGAQHSDSLLILSALASLMEGKGDYTSAEQLRRQVLKTRRQTSGTQDITTLVSLDNLARVLSEKGNHTEAEQLQRQVFNTFEDLLGLDHIDTLISLNNLAATLTHLGNYEEAELLYRKAITAEERLLGPDHFETLRTLSNLGTLLQYSGKYVESERLQRRALESRERILGIRNPKTLISLNNLARLLEEKGEYDDAEQLFKQALEIRVEILGEDHPDTLSSLGCLTNLLYVKGNMEGARDFACRTFLTYIDLSRKNGQMHPKLIEQVNIYVSLLRLTGMNEKQIAKILFDMAPDFRFKIS